MSRAGEGATAERVKPYSGVVLYYSVEEVHALPFENSFLAHHPQATNPRAPIATYLAVKEVCAKASKVRDRLVTIRNLKNERSELWCHLCMGERYEQAHLCNAGIVDEADLFRAAVREWAKATVDRMVSTGYFLRKSKPADRPEPTVFRSYAQTMQLIRALHDEAVHPTAEPSNSTRSTQASSRQTWPTHMSTEFFEFEPLWGGPRNLSVKKTREELFQFEHIKAVSNRPVAFVNEEGSSNDLSNCGEKSARFAYLSQLEARAERLRGVKALKRLKERERELASQENGLRKLLEERKLLHRKLTRSGELSNPHCAHEALTNRRVQPVQAQVAKMREAVGLDTGFPLRREVREAREVLHESLAHEPFRNARAMGLKAMLWSVNSMQEGFSTSCSP